MTDLTEDHDELRPLMFSIAYRMLGSAAEAEDVVQDAFLRLHRRWHDGTAIESPEAYATTVTTRLALDTLRSARVRREQYVGPWLPEPVIMPLSGDTAGSADGDPAHRVEIDETVATAFLVLLESLTPVERAVFILREVFAYEYAEIAGIVDKGEANCRQIFVRAKKHIDEGRPRFDVSSDQRDALASRFLSAALDGDIGGLERLLADDVVLVADGGGRAPAIREPISGAVRVARFLGGLLRQGERMDARIDLVEANGQPALRVHTRPGELIGVMTLDIVDGRVARIHNLINPDKLRHLGPVGDLYALLRSTGTS